MTDGACQQHTPEPPVVYNGRMLQSRDSASTDSAAGRFLRRQNPLLVALVIMAVITLTITLLRQAGPPTLPPEAGHDIRIPVTNPPLEPNRPDLIGEPRIDDPPQ